MIKYHKPTLGLSATSCSYGALGLSKILILKPRQVLHDIYSRSA
jgi:hypothetical protein